MTELNTSRWQELVDEADRAGLHPSGSCAGLWAKAIRTEAGERCMEMAAVNKKIVEAIVLASPTFNEEGQTEEPLFIIWSETASKETFTHSKDAMLAASKAAAESPGRVFLTMRAVSKHFAPAPKVSVTAVPQGDVDFLF